MVPIQKAQFNEKGEARITCTQCGEKTTFKAPKHRKGSDVVMVKCRCGFHFMLSLADRSDRTPVTQIQE